MRTVIIAAMIFSGAVFLVASIALLFVPTLVPNRADVTTGGKVINVDGARELDRYLPSSNSVGTSWSTNGTAHDIGPLVPGFGGSFLDHHIPTSSTAPTNGIVPNVSDTTTEICERTTGIAQTGPTDFKVVECGKAKREP